ncbi:hypothetical protein HDU76_004265 [Blyttiomyces sp. JEL0837]|nr:hypothetical protein HDU76_004265 [Blyttiomyces sp. JEL0837]
MDKPWKDADRLRERIDRKPKRLIDEIGFRSRTTKPKKAKQKAKSKQAVNTAGVRKVSDDRVAKKSQTAPETAISSPRQLSSAGHIRSASPPYNTRSRARLSKDAAPANTTLNRGVKPITDSSTTVMRSSTAPRVNGSREPLKDPLSLPSARDNMDVLEPITRPAKRRRQNVTAAAEDSLLENASHGNHSIRQTISTESDKENHVEGDNGSSSVHNVAGEPSNNNTTDEALADEVQGIERREARDLESEALLGAVVGTAGVNDAVISSTVADVPENIKDADNIAGDNVGGEIENIRPVDAEFVGVGVLGVQNLNVGVADVTGNSESQEGVVGSSGHENPPVNLNDVDVSAAGGASNNISHQDSEFVYARLRDRRVGFGDQMRGINADNSASDGLSEISDESVLSARSSLEESDISQSHHQPGINAPHGTPVVRPIAIRAGPFMSQAFASHLAAQAQTLPLSSPSTSSGGPTALVASADGSSHAFARLSINGSTQHPMVPVTSGLSTTSHQRNVSHESGVGGGTETNLAYHRGTRYQYSTRIAGRPDPRRVRLFR